MIRRPPRSTQSRSSAASDVYKRQIIDILILLSHSILTLHKFLRNIKLVRASKESIMKFLVRIKT